MRLTPDQHMLRKEIRLTRGLSVYDVAPMVGLSRATVRRYELPEQKDVSEASKVILDAFYAELLTKPQTVKLEDVRNLYGLDRAQRRSENMRRAAKKRHTAAREAVHTVEAARKRAGLNGEGS